MTTEPTQAADPDATASVYKLLFAGALDADDPIGWLNELASRIAVAEAAIEAARQQRAMVVAHLHDTFRMSYADIAAASKDPLSPQRAGQLAAKGRGRITPLDPASYR